MLLEFQERMIMVEEWWSLVLKGVYVWVTHTLNIGVCKSAQWWQEVSGDKEQDGSGAGEEGYAAGYEVQ